MRRFGRLAVAGAAASLLLGFVAAGCDSGYVNRLNEPNHSPQVIDNPVPALPALNSPANLLRALELTYNIRWLWAYEHLFTDDFLLNCSPTDSAGNSGTPWTRMDEVLFARHFFHGGGPDRPAAVSIDLMLDPNFLVFPDPNYKAWDPLGRWHKSIRSTVAFRAMFADQSSIEMLGHATFYVVRGDSAVIPNDLVQTGAHPDSTRWYIRRWDDETAGPAAAAARRAQPADVTTWCALKERYR